MSVRIVKGWSYFDRKRLRKIYILKNSDGVFQIHTHVLDKDTLTIGKAISFWTKETFEIVTTCLLQNGEIFKNENYIKIAYFTYLFHKWPIKHLSSCQHCKRYIICLMALYVLIFSFKF